MEVLLDIPYVLIDGKLEERPDALSNLNLHEPACYFDPENEESPTTAFSGEIFCMFANVEDTMLLNEIPTITEVEASLAKEGFTNTTGDDVLYCTAVMEPTEKEELHGSYYFMIAQPRV